MTSKAVRASARVLISLCASTALAANESTTGPTTGPTTKPALAFASSAFANNFAADEGEVTLQLPQGAHATGGSIRVTDELGRSIGEVPVAAGSASTVVPLKGKGFYALSANVTLDGGAALTASTTASVVGPLLPNDVRLNAPFGFFSVRGTTPLPAISGGTWERLFVPIHSIKRDVNGELKWSSAQPPGPKNPQTVDGQPTPLKWVGVCMYPPPWTVAEDLRKKVSVFAVYPPSDWEGFAKAITFAAKHYAQWVTYFEPINEPDANWRGTDEELVKYHTAVADAVHAAGVPSKVVGPCLSSIDMPRLRKLAKLGLFDHLDGVSIHAYSNDAPPEGKWLDNLLELKSFMRSLGKENMPLVISEYGWQTAPGDWARPVDQLTQARYAARSLTLLAAEQVDAINYFCLRYEDPRIPHVQGWSVVEHDNTPRPAYAAIPNVSHWLAGVQGAGTVLHPVPDSFLVLFKKGNGSVAVVWTTRGESTFQIPGQWRRVNDMTGRTVTPNEKGVIPVSESPTFIELEDAALPAVQLQSPASVIRGSEVQLNGDWSGAAVSSALSLDGNRLKATDAAAAGEYLVLARNGDGSWKAAPVNVLPRFAVESASPSWPAGAAQPVVRMTVRAHGDPVSVLPTVKLNGAAPRFGERVDVAADGSATVDVPLNDLPLDRRWTGKAVVEARVNGQVETSEAPLDLAVVPGGHFGNDESPDWSTVPKVASAGWPSFGPGTDVKPVAPEDCSATLQWAYAPKGLHLRIDVRDDAHQQSRDPQQMWQQDSLQIGLDVDADKPWQANLNNDLVGLNGHRVFEYGVALRDGQAVTARWREDIVKLAADAPPVAAKVTRQGDHTIYDITFPWPSLGLSGAPAAGTSIGFDLVVNDTDAPTGKRHGLEMFSGINASKDPEQFGRLLLR